MSSRHTQEFCEACRWQARILVASRHAQVYTGEPRMMPHARKQGIILYSRIRILVNFHSLPRQLIVRHEESYFSLRAIAHVKRGLASEDQVNSLHHGLQYKCS